MVSIFNSWYIICKLLPRNIVFSCIRIKSCTCIIASYVNETVTVIIKFIYAKMAFSDEVREEHSEMNGLHTKKKARKNTARLRVNLWAHLYRFSFAFKMNSARNNHGRWVITEEKREGKRERQREGECGTNKVFGMSTLAFMLITRDWERAPTTHQA